MTRLCVKSSCYSSSSLSKSSAFYIHNWYRQGTKLFLFWCPCLWRAVLHTKRSPNRIAITISSMLLCFSQCRKNYIYLRFYKFIIYSVTRTEFFSSLLTITVTTSLLRVPPALSPRISSPTISLISCTTSTILTSVLNPVTERRDLKTFLISIQIKKKSVKRADSEVRVHCSQNIVEVNMIIDFKNWEEIAVSIKAQPASAVETKIRDQ